MQAKWRRTWIAEVSNVETTRAWDIDGCSVPEVAVWKLFGPGRFEKHVVHRFEGRARKGLCCGDVAGNDRMDIVTSRGWLEAPRHAWTGEWRWHEGPAVGRMTGVPILIVDVNGDGTPELVTGKRHRAHNGHEAGEWDDLEIYYYRWNGEGFTRNVVSHVPIGIGKGCGIHFALADLRGTGRLDLVAAGKDGLTVF